MHWEPTENMPIDGNQEKARSPKFKKTRAGAPPHIAVTPVARGGDSTGFTTGAHTAGSYAGGTSPLTLSCPLTSRSKSELDCRIASV